MSMYDSWLAWKQNPAQIAEVKKEIKDYDKLDDKKRAIDIERLLLGYWIMENENRRSFEPETSIFKDFPLSELVGCLQIYLEYGRIMPAEEFGKVVYLLWPKYMVKPDGTSVKHGEHNRHYPHNLIFETLYAIKEKVYHLSTILDELQNYGTYYLWHLLGYYALLGDKGEKMLLEIITKRYNDAHEMITFGMYQFEPTRFYPTFKKILKYWDEHENICFHTGTGIMSSLSIILDKYKKSGIDFENDEEMREIWEKHQVLECYQLWLQGKLD